MKMKSQTKKRIALLLAFALIAGLLPLNTPTVSKADGYGVSNPRITEGITTWDCIYFGNYWQEDTNGDGTADKNDAKTPIKWRVLSVDGDDAFLLADKNLDCQKYNDTYKNVTWETCTMRSWLNGYGASNNVCGTDYSSGNFLDYAFTAGEQSAIKTTTVVNEDNPNWGTEGGNNTSDQVYLLSIGEVRNPDYGFNTFAGITETKESVNTAYAKTQGAWTSSSTEYAGNGAWWLRSPGNVSGLASYVDDHGDVNTYGSNVHYISNAARPALHLNLKASSDAISTSSWSYAGTVTSDGRADEEAPPVPGEDTTPEPTVSWEPLPTETPIETATPTFAPKPTATPTVTPTASPENKTTSPSSFVAFKTQTIKTTKIKTIKVKTLKKKSVKVNLKAKADGNSKLTYKVTKYPKGMKKYIKVNKIGVVTFKKKAKKGTYKIRITAAASGKYKKTTKVISIKVK